MEFWFLIILTLSISALLRSVFTLIFPPDKPTIHKLPEPSILTIICRSLWLWKPFELERFLRSLHAEFGPIVSLRIGSRPTIFVADRFLAHQALIQNETVFASRAPPGLIYKVSGSSLRTISSSLYGPTWRAFRRNLTAGVLHPSRIQSYAHARKRVMQTLNSHFELLSKCGKPVRLLDYLQFPLFCLLALMCLGDMLDEEQIKKIEEVRQHKIVNRNLFGILNLWPSWSKIVFRKRWAAILKCREDQQDLLIPLIRARREKLKEEKIKKDQEDCTEEKDEYVFSYVDTLFDLQLPEEKRNLTEKEIVSLCSEFLTAGFETNLSALHWIMGNMVKYPQIQEKLFLEIKGVVGDEGELKEEYLQRMPYLKAVILEGLRRHPPGHFVMPHAVTEDVVLDKYLVPKNSTINFMVSEIGWDPKVWEDPMAFKPERFLNDGGEEFDITGRREIKMMPFGAGRRICPGNGLAMFHLEYFLANLVWKFEWKAVNGNDIDLSEKQEGIVVMKYPLEVLISSRS